MPVRTFLLTDSSNELIGRVIFFAIVGVFWLISAVASAVKKQRETAAARNKLQNRNVIPQPVPRRAPQPMPAAPANRPGDPRITWPPIPALRQVPPQAAKQANVRRGKKKQPKAPPPLPTAAPIAAAATAAAATAARRSIQSPPAGQTAMLPPPRSADAESLRRWLTPQTLRSQFILTEMLNPPLALRPDRH